jgi:diaminopimelate epimerase
MHGQGNDFVMLNGISQTFDLTPSQIRALADRNKGVGFDQLLVVEKPQRTDADFRYRIFNADGGEVEQCGNGARCFAQFVHDEGLTDKREIRVETLSGVIVPRLEDNGMVTVDFGAPRFIPADIPFVADAEALRYELDVAGTKVTIAVLAIGNPHAVQVVDNVDTAPVREQGPLIEHHSRFPRRINAGYMQVIGRTEIRVRVWERGAGETLACGTGACAAALTGMLWGLLDETVTVHARGGDLTVTWQGRGQPVLMSGATATVFKGELSL